MKTKLFLLLLVSFYFNHQSNAQVWCGPYTPGPTPPNGFVTRSIAFFGGFPDDCRSDQAAFEAAFDYFQNNSSGPGNGILIIPPGIYDVGQQDINNGSFYACGHPVFSLQNASNFSIIGTLNNGRKPVIRYEACLRIGSFDPNTHGRFLAWEDNGIPNSGFNDPLYQGFINNCFEFYNSSNITIRDIELDGNIDEAKIGGYWSRGYRGIEGPNDGIYLFNCENVNIENVNVHHFGQDGINIEASTPGFFIFTNIIKTNSESNCRNGLSWRGGSDLSVIASRFDFNGWGPFTSWTNFWNDPSGINISWAGGADIANGFFQDVWATHNWGSGIFSEADPNTAFHAFNFSFTRCHFVGSHEPNNPDPDTWLRGWAAVPGLCWATWNNCDFFGNIVRPFALQGFQGFGPVFNDCFFSDVFQGNLICNGDWSIVANQYSGPNGDANMCFIIQMTGPPVSCDRTFNNCTFERYCTDQYFYAEARPGSTEIQLNNCHFIDRQFRPGQQFCYQGVWDFDNAMTLNNCTYDTPLPLNGGGGFNFTSIFSTDVLNAPVNTVPLSSFFPYNQIQPETQCPPVYTLPPMNRLQMECGNCVALLDAVDCVPPICRPGQRLASNIIHDTQNRIAPNPANTFVTVSDLNLNDEVIIRDVFGKEIIHIISRGSSMEIDINKLSKGVYFISASNKFIGKLIKD